MFRNHIAKSKLDLIDIYNHAIESIKPEQLINKAFSIKGNILTIKSGLKYQVPISINLEDKNVHLIGGGKSALAMACGVAGVAERAGLTHLFSHGLLSLPIGQKSILNQDLKTMSLLDSVHVKCMFGSKNNLPDKDSISATKAILSEVKKASKNDELIGRKPLFLVLISGGGSACLSYPRYISLEEKLKLIKFLVQKGADITDLNIVRRFYSFIKGGQLARFIFDTNPDCQIKTLILSDVIGDPIESIASGPTSNSCVIDQFEDSLKLVLDILKKYGYPIEDLHMPEKQKTNLSNSIESKQLSNIILGNNMIAIEAAREKAESLGYRVVLLGNDLQGPGEKVVEQLTRKGTELSGRVNRLLVLGGGETTIIRKRDDGWGVGGRAQEMALDYMISRLSSSPQLAHDVDMDIFMAGGTDGQDGPTDVAACLASYREWQDTQTDSFCLADATKAKQLHDSNSFWKKFKPDWLIKTGLTGTNVMDLYMLMLINKRKSKL